MTHTILRYILPVLYALLTVPVLANDTTKTIARDRWVEARLSELTLEEKIGQLYMMPAYSNQNEAAYKEIERQIQKYKLGGLIFMQGTAEKQAELTNRYQKLSKIPLFVAIDAEWGLGMRLEDAVSFPKNMMLGATNDPDLLEELGREIGRQCKRIGVNINFAPVVDLNSNPKNPVIGVRSFGEDKFRVSLLASAFGRGLQSENVLACMKHFPGHGDTNTDSHYALPHINKSREAILQNEIYPFSYLSEENFGAAMVGHLHVPALDDRKNMPATLSEKIIRKILIDSLKFEGLIFTDAMNMHGLADYNKAGEADVRALLAGNDILLFPLNIEKGINAVKEAIQTGEFTEQMLNEKVRKILRAKYKLGLHQYQPVNLLNIKSDLHKPSANILIEKIYAKSVIVAKNECGLLPFKNIENQTFASVLIGGQKDNDFQKMLGRYARFEHFTAHRTQNFNDLFEKLKNKKVVIVGLTGLTEKAVSDNYGTTFEMRNFIRKLEEYTKVVVVVFGNPYALKFFEESEYLVCAHNGSSLAQKAVPQVLFGAQTNKARMPVTASEGIPAGIGYDIAFMQRFSFSDYPETAGLDGAKLKLIDKMVEEGLKNKYMPGCQVLVARKGVVVHNKGYGNYTYDTSENPVSDETVYDLASCTKVISVVPAMMHLYECNKINLSDPVSTYLPDLCDTDKESVSLKQVLAHQSPLYPYLPLSTRSFTSEDGDVLVSSTSIGGEVNPFEEAMSDENFAQNAEKLLWNWVLSTPVKQAKGEYYPYVYGDLGFLVLKKMAEYNLGKRLDRFVEEKLAAPLGLSTLTYNPLKKIPREKIVPTSYDKYLRKKITWGEVNDNAAALLGGVAGHSGLFGNALDVAVYSQMLLQKGNYGGVKYFEESTIKEFTKRQFPHSRRGAGWDKAIPGNLQPAGKTVPAETFGHRGYTGTCFWIDPVNELIFVFLCNRTYPNASNWKLNKSGLREHLNDLIHSAILKN
jgi:beta-glucosidase-like glycosyl hydrolase/CubicO group peptidase (beta-lactamase class C family)